MSVDGARLDSLQTAAWLGVAELRRGYLSRSCNPALELRAVALLDVAHLDYSKARPTVRVDPDNPFGFRHGDIRICPEPQQVLVKERGQQRVHVLEHDVRPDADRLR